MRNIKYDIQECDQIIRITDQNMKILYSSDYWNTVPIISCFMMLLCGMPLNIQCRSGFLFVSLSLFMLSHLTNKQRVQLPQSIIQMLNLAGIRSKTDDKKIIVDI